MQCNHAAVFLWVLGYNLTKVGVSLVPKHRLLGFALEIEVKDPIVHMPQDVVVLDDDSVLIDIVLHENFHDLALS